MKNILLSIVLVSLWGTSLAQTKYEKEYRIRQDAVPERARAFIASVFEKANIQWYAEESHTGKSIEAKLRASGKRYSIEFDESGKIQDVEIMSSMKQIDAKTRNILKDNLEKTFTKYKVTKTQRQWSGSEDNLKRAIATGEAKGIVTKYELVVRGTKDKRTGYFEVESESDGSITSVREIVQRNADNLIY